MLSSIEVNRVGFLIKFGLTDVMRFDNLAVYNCCIGSGLVIAFSITVSCLYCLDRLYFPFQRLDFPKYLIYH
jgi:hypothetical protein